MSRPLTDAIERGLEEADTHAVARDYVMSNRTKAAIAAGEVERIIRQRVGDLGFELLFPTPKNEEED